MKEQKQFSDIPKEDIPKIEALLRRILVEGMPVAPERIKSVSIFDPGMRDKTSLEVIFDPELNEVEAKRYVTVLKAVNAIGGGRPIIIAGNA